jgi:hypothetical protein
MLTEQLCELQLQIKKKEETNIKTKKYITSMSHDVKVRQREGGRVREGSSQMAQS